MGNEIGNALSIFGILVTFIAYFGGHGRRWQDLEPGLARRVASTRSWLRRILGREPAGRTIHAGMAHGLAIGGSARVFTWRGYDEDADLDTKIEAIFHNLDRLRKDAEEDRKEARERLGKAVTRLDKSITEMRAHMRAREQAEREATTTAMRWEVRGLLIALAGSLVSLIFH